MLLPMAITNCLWQFEICLSFSSIRWQNGSKRKEKYQKETKTQEEQCVIDDEMQIRTTTMKSLEKTVTNPIPSTVPKNSKESNVSVCTGITSDET